MQLGFWRESMRSLLFTTLALSTAMTLTACSKDEPEKTTKSPRQQLQTASANNLNTSVVKVTDEAGNPVPTAQVLIGTELNQPFPNNFVTTTASGEILVPAAWTEPTAVTISAPGYMRTTYLDQLPMGQSLVIRAIEP